MKPSPADTLLPFLWLKSFFKILTLPGKLLSIFTVTEEPILPTRYLGKYVLFGWFYSTFLTILNPLIYLLLQATPAAYGSSQAGVESELQPLAHFTATVDPSRICNLHHSSQQRGIPDPLSKAKD